ncbi:FIG015547: peptidase, M16 family [hydrothermal vent metagenome]|uniref:FIG015547: peptidase, M16 family n=1 Tax=hydrothermal vent metagenome TaxID=652676 RepID=A0A3B0W9Z6_9ZZZZ
MIKISSPRFNRKLPRTLFSAAACFMLSFPVFATVTEYQLDNGMHVVVKEDHRAPVVVHQVWYRVGGNYEQPGKTGLSHMLEHMMFKGTKSLKPGEFSKIVSKLGGQENAFTSANFTAYYQVVGKQHLERVMELESDRMRNLIIDDEEFYKERDVVTEERRWRLEDKPNSKLYEQFNAVAFLNSPARNPVIGWMTDIRSYTPQDMRDWYKQWYAPNNATLVVVGDVEPKQVLAFAQKYYGKYQAETIPTLKPQTEIKQEGMRRIELKGATKVPSLQMGFHVPSLVTAKTPEEKQEVYALSMLSSILDDGDSSRLPTSIVREQKIASSVSSYYSSASRLTTLFQLSGTPTTGHTVEEVEKALLAEIEKLKTDKVSKQEMERVWAMSEASYVYAQDSTQAQAMMLGRLLSVGLPADILDDWIEQLRTVTPEQIQAVAQKYLHSDNLTVGTLYPDGKEHSGLKAYRGRH